MSERCSRHAEGKKRRSNRIIPTELSPMKLDVRILIKARGGINRCAILLKDRVY